MDLRAFPALIYAICYLIGSIPFGVLVARVFHVKDLRAKGSGNIGATNVSRIVGFWPAGALTFLLDVGKGAMAVFLAGPFGLRLGERLMDLSGFELGPEMAWTAGFFVVLGHCYSPWLHFRGGKGVATGFGAILLLSPLAALAGMFAFLFTFVSKRISSLSSLAGLAIASVVHVVIHPMDAYLWAGAAMILVILLRHEDNIDALLANREKSF